MKSLGMSYISVIYCQDENSEFEHIPYDEILY